MTDTRVALRYAKAFMDLAQEKSLLEQAREDMRTIDSLCRHSRELVNVLCSPIIKHDKKADILEKVLFRKVCSLTLEELRFIIIKGRAEVIPNIAIQFHWLYNEQARIQPARITTPFPLTDALRKEVESLVKKCSARETVELEELIDKSLIGGFVLDIGDRQINASLSHQLKMLKVGFSTPLQTT